MKQYLSLAFFLCVGSVAIAEPSVELKPTTLDFKTQTTEIASKAQTVTLKNVGQDELKNLRFSIGGTNKDEFSTPTTTCQPLASKKSCTISITFTPKKEGARNALLSVKSNASTSPDEVILKGTGKIEEPKVSLTPSAVSFGAQAVGTTSTEKTVTLKNTGKGLLKNISVKIEGKLKNEFATPTTTCTPLKPGESCTMTVTFTPKTEGNQEATLSVKSSASSSPNTITLKGIGKAKGAEYASLNKGMAINLLGESMETAAEFFGGIAVEGGEFSEMQEVKLILGDNGQPIGESVVVAGVIAPDAEDVGKKADTFVVGFYVYPDIEGHVIGSFEDCQNPTPEKGGFYMLSNREALAIEAWDTNPATLLPLDRGVTVSDPLMLTEESGLELYKGNFYAPGRLCVYFAYQTTGGKLVFNGEKTINIVITQFE
jgi:hypothetical protein